VWPRGFQEVYVPRFHDIRQVKVVRLSASRTGRLYPPEMFLVLIFTRGWVDPRVMVRSEGDMSLKNPVTPPGIVPGTVRLVAQRLNHYATPGPTFNRTMHNYARKRVITCISTCNVCIQIFVKYVTDTKITVYKLSLVYFISGKILFRSSMNIF
jgi:hypothetical protein